MCRLFANQHKADLAAHLSLTWFPPFSFSYPLHAPCGRFYSNNKHHYFNFLFIEDHSHNPYVGVMTPPRGKLFYLSGLYKKPKSLWLDPESSVDKHCGMKNGKNCWIAKGPAQEAFQQISSEIKEVLEKDCGPVPGSHWVLFDIFMIGDAPATAIPHIMFSCPKPGPRKEARTAVRNSDVLSHCTPGIALGHWDYPPHIKSPQPLASSLTPVESHETKDVNQCYLTPIFDKHQPRKVPAIRLGLHSSFDEAKPFAKATVGSIVEVDEKRFYLVPAHVFSKRIPPQDVTADGKMQESDSECEFGGFDDGDEDFADDGEVTFMSQYSITPEVSDLEVRSDPGGSQSSSDEVREDTQLNQHQEEINHDARSSPLLGRLPPKPVKPERVDVSGKDHTIRLEIKSPFFTSTELDFALIEVSKIDYLTASLPFLRNDTIASVNMLADVIVTTMTGSGKTLTGKLSGRPSFIRLPNASKYQKILTVDFEGCLQIGDCGSIVRNASDGKIYGHIIAGSVESRIAYIIPAVDVLHTIEQRFNLKSGSDVPSSASLPASIQDVNRRYTVGWICSSSTEFRDAWIMLDERHLTLPRFAGSSVSYILGKIGQHNVVIACPSERSNAAAWVASQILLDFPHIRFCLAVSVSSGISTLPLGNIQLGDIVVGMPGGSRPGVVQYKTFNDQDVIRVKGKVNLAAPPKPLRAAVTRLKNAHKMGKDHFLTSRSRPVPNNLQSLPSSSEPISEHFNARVYNQTAQPLEANFRHQCLTEHCKHVPKVHHGLIALITELLNEEDLRRLVHNDSDEFLCLEKEVERFPNRFPCLFVRGICDLVDSPLPTKEKAEARVYAATTAATYARDLLLTLPEHKVLKMPLASKVINDCKYFLLALCFR